MTDETKSDSSNDHKKSDTMQLKAQHGNLMFSTEICVRVNDKDGNLLRHIPIANFPEDLHSFTADSDHIFVSIGAPDKGTIMVYDHCDGKLVRKFNCALKEFEHLESWQGMKVNGDYLMIFISENSEQEEYTLAYFNKCTGARVKI